MQIGDLYYRLDDATRTAEVISDPSYETTLTEVEIPERVIDGDKSYGVTSIGDDAFSLCSALKSVSAPSVTSIGMNAFDFCTSLASLTVSSAMEAEWESKKDGYGISPFLTGLVVTFVTPPTLSRDQVAQAGWEVKEAEVETTVSVKVVADQSVTLKVDEQTISEDEYANDCAYYGIKQQTKPETPPVPTAEDYKFVPSGSVVVPEEQVIPEGYKAVPQNAQVVQEGEIAVKKESIAAPSAGTVKVEDGKVLLGVTVLKTSDLTAEKKDWGKVKLTKEDIDVDADGNIIVNVPVDSQSGFMVIQSGDAKIKD